MKKDTETFCLEALRNLDRRAAAIREALGISEPGREIFSWEYGDIDEDLIVIADGYGGASLQRVEGDGDNRLIHESREFATEAEACDVANQVMVGDLELDEALPEDSEMPRRAAMNAILKAVDEGSAER